MPTTQSSRKRSARLVARVFPLLATGLLACGSSQPAPQEPVPAAPGAEPSAPPADPAPSSPQVAQAAESPAPARPVVPKADPLEKVPGDYAEVRPVSVRASTSGSVVMLLNTEHTALVPIFIGETEALSISLNLQHRRHSRPLTQELFARIIENLGGDLIRVQVDKLEANVFHGSVLIRHEGRIRSYDARPSDAIALAVQADRPIFMASAVLDQAGIQGAELELALEQLSQSYEKPQP